MPTIHTLALGDYQTNTYIVSGNGKGCVLIDPGFEPQTILDHVAELGMTVEAILLTHGHFDHVGAVEKIVATTGCELWLHKADWDLPSNPTNRYIYPLSGNNFTDILFCGESNKIQAAGLCFNVLSTPGHTPGSVCFLCEDHLFSGDTLFAGSCGRTDLPGGDTAAMRLSLRRLAVLDRPVTIHPGHGPATTLRQERLSNPYLR
jgi:glyoxylase-like metal-dependent hydrolase (beta-lactamase superfamily II)